MSYDRENPMKISTEIYYILYYILSFEIGFRFYILIKSKKKSVFLINLTLSHKEETKFIETNHLIFRNL